MNEKSISYFRLILGYFCLVWYLVIICVALIGFFGIVRAFSKIDRNVRLDKDVEEGVTILRPIKGIDPELSRCLESSFQQLYPKSRIQILFCIDDPNDESLEIIEDLIDKYPDIDSQILISKNFDRRTARSDEYYGPNPKVNNLAKGFAKAKYDILWIMDSNVWASPYTLAHSVKALNNNTNMGTPNSSPRKIRLVHHVPLALSINPASADTDQEFSHSVASTTKSSGRFLKKLGARLDEMFLLTSHSKFYVSLNNIALAPCVNGKSNIYRMSDIDRAVAKIESGGSKFFSSQSTIKDSQKYSSLGPGNGIKLFARYIAEDNMIAICLWENLFSKTALCGDFVVQPLSGTDNSVNDYIERRVRWLRVRKYMVLTATLIEPTTESILCGLCGAFALSTVLHLESFCWTYFWIHMTIWVIKDYIQYYTFIRNIAKSNYEVPWLKAHSLPPLKRKSFTWLYVWLMRELLALPIWIKAMCGHRIFWRGKAFKIKNDLTAEEL